MTIKTTKYLTIFSSFVIIFFMMYLVLNGYLFDQNKLSIYLNSFGIFAPLIFILIQIIQVVIPIIPGGVSSSIGVILFDAKMGFIYNYIGIVIGSIIVFMIVRKYGKNFILKICNIDTYHKYIGYLDQGKRFDILFALAIFVPGLPDDVICMLAALTSITLKRYIIINVVFRPFSLLAYSLGISGIMDYLGNLI